MPLSSEDAAAVLAYCRRDLPADSDWYESQFDFVADLDLRASLAREFYAARFIYKLMEALGLSGRELHAHLKFQIIQYASIYEAVVNHVLTDRFKNHQAYIALCMHKSYRPVSALASPSRLLYDGEEVVPCLYKDAKTPWNSISFSDKLKTAVDLGLVEETYAEEIKTLYQLRNAVHIETAAKRGVEYEIEQAKLAYRRMEPILSGIRLALGANQSAPAV